MLGSVLRRDTSAFGVGHEPDNSTTLYVRQPNSSICTWKQWSLSRQVVWFVGEFHHEPCRQFVMACESLLFQNDDTNCD